MIEFSFLTIRWQYQKILHSISFVEKNSWNSQTFVMVLVCHGIGPTYLKATTGDQNTNKCNKNDIPAHNVNRLWLNFLYDYQMKISEDITYYFVEKTLETLKPLWQ